MSDKDKKDFKKDMPPKKETEQNPQTTEETKIQESPGKPVAENSADPQNVQILSRQDTFVSDLVKEQPSEDEVTTLANIKARSVPNILELPEECYPLHGKKYRYRWLAKDERLEARLRSSIWMLCTRTNSPYIKPHRFKSHGAVEQAGMLLAFAPENIALAREEEPAKKSAQLVKHYTEDIHKQGSKETGGYYKPETAGDEDDTGDEGLVME